ncbi:hypothetical protein [Salicibibacter cibarius]
MIITLIAVVVAILNQKNSPLFTMGKGYFFH